jgi:hypothetical protein
MATNNGWNNNIANANSAITLNSGVNAVSVSTDASATTVNIGTGAAAKTVTVGSTNGASASTLQSGTGALNVTATNGALTVNSGTGVLGISTDASATTVNIATGAAAKLATLGSTNGASSLALKYGTADFSLASATGNVMVAQDTGEITKPLQPAFLASLTNITNNVTGNGTFYSVIYDNEIFDQGNNFDLGTSIFTAPIAGRYCLNATVYFSGLVAGMTDARLSIVCSNRTIHISRVNPVAVSVATLFACGNSSIVDMDAGDTAQVRVFVGGGALVVDMFGDPGLANSFGGYLAC